MKSGPNSDVRWTKRALKGALERASCLTQEASLGKAWTALGEHGPMRSGARSDEQWLWVTSSK